MKNKAIEIWDTELPGYKLLDSGQKEKLEEINGNRIIRKEPRAWWQKTLKEEDWSDTTKELEGTVEIGVASVKARVNFKEASKHIGIFPEQAGEWRWIEQKIKNSKSQNPNKKIKVLNLFGYTGIASLVAAASGAEVTHVDSSKQSVEWARENQKISGLESLPIRWIVDDAVKFLKREIKRLAPRGFSEVEGESMSAEEAGYDAIIMDPPSYGKGPKGEVWKAETKLPDFLKLCGEALSDTPLFVILNMYSTELSSLSLSNMLLDMMEGKGGAVTAGELAIKQEASDKVLPMSIFSIWENLN